VSIILFLLTGIVSVILLVYFWLERSFIPRPSTKRFFSLSRLPLYKLLEGYFYAGQTHRYLKLAKLNWLFELLGQSETGDSYHAKVLTKGDAVKILTLKEPLNIPDLDKVIPYPVARSIILEHPLPSVAVMECPCRAQKPGSCPRDVCLVVGEPFVSFMVEHRPEKARRIGSEEALNILEEEERRGHIHTAWFKDAMHNRFYAICNCCSCCCLGMASYFRGVPRMAHSGYRPVIDKIECCGCGSCSDICPFNALEPTDTTPQLDPELCMGCGLCTTHCPCDAIKLVHAPEKGVPLDVEMLNYNSTPPTL
jgi:Pyruvate/2-oxoacid:ferredoxin oxidoreductase delta subunit